jgi:hypothetical protein
MPQKKNDKLTNEAEALHFVSQFNNDLAEVPTKLMTKKVCDAAFKMNPYSRTYVWIPEKHRTFAMCLKAAPDYGAETKDFANGQLQSEWGISVSAFVALKKKGKLPNLKKVTDPEIILVCYKKAFASEAAVIKSMPQNLISKIVNVANINALINATRDNGSFSRRNTWIGDELIKYAPKKLMTDGKIKTFEERFISETKNSHVSIQDIPDEYITDEMLEAYVEKSPTSLEYIPEDRLTKNMCDIAVKKDGRAIKAVPQEWRGDFYNDVVKTGKGLDSIPEEDRSDRLCTLAVETEASEYQHVPQDKKSYALSLAAVDNDAQMIEFVPTELVDDEMMIRLMISIFRKNYEYDFSLTGLIDYRKERGQTEPVLTMVFNAFFGDARSYEKRDKLKELAHEVIKRDAKLYFALLNYSGQEDDRFNGRENASKFHSYFQGVPDFDHAVTAARTDIETVTGFKQHIQAKVWREFLENNK